MKYKNHFIICKSAAILTPAE